MCELDMDAGMKSDVARAGFRRRAGDVRRIETDFSVIARCARYVIASASRADAKCAGRNRARTVKNDALRFARDVLQRILLPTTYHSGICIANDS